VVKKAEAVKSAESEGGSSAAIMVTRYIEGSHGTPSAGGNTASDPLTSGAVFNEILQQTVTFFALGGIPLTGPIIANPEVIEP